MRILLSTLIVSLAAAHGGPVIAARHARALARRGISVRIVAPDVEEHDFGTAVSVERYETTPTRKPLARWRHDPRAVESLESAIARFAPDVVYDVHGPAWAIEAAGRTSTPAVTMVGDFNWFCRRTFLVDGRKRRCSGPENERKCFRCLNADSSPRQAVLRSALRHPLPAAAAAILLGQDRLVAHRLWDAVGESSEYSASLRSSIDRFVVGDEHARRFLLRHGIPQERLAHLQQCLPPEARRMRRTREPGAGLALRIGFVGRPHYDKGLHVLARAFDALPRDVGAQLWIIHSTLAVPEAVAPMFPDAGRFRALHESGKIRLVRPAHDEEIYRAMAEVDVACVPSLQFESPGLAMLEFVAQRTPIVRSESAGMDHVIQDRVNGRTFPYGDWGALREILLEILADRSVLRQWSHRLPEVGSDAEYAAGLEALFANLSVSSPVTAIGA